MNDINKLMESMREVVAENGLSEEDQILVYQEAICQMRDMIAEYAEHCGKLETVVEAAENLIAGSTYDEITDRVGANFDRFRSLQVAIEVLTPDGARND